jgi:hypothetical protein
MRANQISHLNSNKLVIPGERAFARGKGTQVFQHRQCFTTWIPFPSLGLSDSVVGARSAGNDTRFII